MAGTNDFLPLATGGSANVIDQATFAALSSLLANGFQSGVANSAQINKVFRQSSFVASAVAKIIADNNVNALDDGDVAGFKTKLIAAIQAQLTIQQSQIQSVSASVASNALTLGYAGGSLQFRSATLTTGTPNTRTAGALSLVVPSGATLGTVSGQPSRLAVIAIDYAGNIELAVTNTAGNLNLDETTLISSTAISGASDSENVVYSTTARSNVPFRVVGFIDINEAAAGSWATAPTLVQGAGGLAAPFAGRSMIRLITANGYGSTNTMIRRFSTVVANQGGDITYADSATLGASFTINASGVYAITYVENYSNANNRSGISLNSSQLTTGIDSINAADRLAATEAYIANYSNSCSWTGFLPSGSVIRPHNEGQPASSVSPSFTISRVS